MLINNSDIMSFEKQQLNYNFLCCTKKCCHYNFTSTILPLDFTPKSWHFRKGSGFNSMPVFYKCHHFSFLDIIKPPFRVLEINHSLCCLYFIGYHTKWISSMCSLSTCMDMENLLLIIIHL